MKRATTEELVNDKVTSPGDVTSQLLGALQKQQHLAVNMDSRNDVNNVAGIFDNEKDIDGDGIGYIMLMLCVRLTCM